MQISSSRLFLLSGCLMIFSCKQVKDMAIQSPTPSQATYTASSHTDAAPYQEPDLTEFLQLFSQEENEEDIERDFVEGCTQMMRGNLEEALNYFSKVLEADPANHPAQYNSARIHYEQRNYDLAADLAKRALATKPDNYWYHHLLVQILGTKGDINKAIDRQQALVERFPEKLQDQIDLADLYFKNSQVDQGIKVLDKIEKDKGVNSRISLRKYDIYNSRKDFDAALETIQNLITSGETSPAIFHRQFETLQKLNRGQEAAKSLESILEIDPDNGYALLTLADYYKRQDQIEKSDSYLFRAFGNANIDPQGKIRIIEQLIPFAQESSVKERLNKLVDIFNETHPENPKGLMLTGKLSTDGETNPANLDNYRKALEQNPQQTKLWIELLDLSYKARDYKQLNLDAELALEYYPNQTEFLYYYGESSLMLEKFSPAQYAFKKLKKIATADPLASAQASLGLGSLYAKQNKSDQAKVEWESAHSILEKAKKLQPDEYKVYEFLGNYYALTGVPELAENEWKLAIEKGAPFSLEDKMKAFSITKE